MPTLVTLEQQLAAEIGPPHNYKGFPQGYPQGATAAANSTAAAAAAGPGSSEPDAASEQNLPGTAAATAGSAAGAVSAGVGAVGGKAAGVGSSALHRVNTAAVSMPGRSVMESLVPDMAELKEVAEVRRVSASNYVLVVQHCCGTAQHSAV